MSITSFSGDIRRRRRLIVAGTLFAALTVAVVVVVVLPDRDRVDAAGRSTRAVPNVVGPDITSVTVISDVAVRVVVDPAAPPAATLAVDDELIDELDLWVADGTELFVGWRSGLDDVNPRVRPTLTVRLPHLSRVVNRAAGHVDVRGVMGDVFRAVNEGDGSVSVTGASRWVTVDATGAGGVFLAGLCAEQVHLAHAGSGFGRLTVCATDRMTGDIAGDRDVRLYGDADVSAVELMGDGAVVRV